MADKNLEIRRLTAPIEVREVGEGDDTSEVITGYAAKFNRDSEVLGGFVRFIEQIDPHAFDQTRMDGAVANINHDSNQVLGRNGVNLDLTVDDIGLRFTVKPTDTSYSRDLMTNIKAGVISQCSFAFTIPDDDDAQDWREADEEGVDYRRLIRKIDRLFDVSVVTTPAYPDTEAVVDQRSMDRVKQLQWTKEKNAVQTERKKMLLDLERRKLLDSIEGGN